MGRVTCVTRPSLFEEMDSMLSIIPKMGRKGNDMSKFNNEYVKGVLRTEGTRFVNEDGQEIILHGYGTANWMNVEGFMIGEPPVARDMFKYILFPGEGKDHNPTRWSTRRTVDLTIRELCGPKYLETFWDRWEENHLQEADIALMAELGYNCVRLVLNANALLYEEEGITFNEKCFKRLSNALDWCEKHKIYAILDMHGVVGGNNGATGDSLFCEFPSVFLDDESTERQIILWEEIVRRFHDRWIIAGYDLINEPVSSPIQHKYIPLLDQYYAECIERLRKIDPVHIMFIEPSKFARDPGFLTHPFDPDYNNWAISIHLYGASPEIKDLYPWLLKREEFNVPLWLGECGNNPDANGIFYEICAHYGIAYTPWAWKTADNGKFPVGSVGAPLPKDWDKICNFLTTGARPSYKESQRIMDEYIENLKLEHCTVNRDNARISAKHPSCTISGVGYDMWDEDGSRHYGTWELSNYLDFRLEDHTKLVWATDKRLPYPKFAWYDDPNELRYDPLTDLALELAENEFANYTVREVTKDCALTIEGIGEGEAEVLCNGATIGTIKWEKGDILNPAKSSVMTIAPTEEAVVKIRVIRGTITVKKLIFEM